MNRQERQKLLAAARRAAQHAYAPYSRFRVGAAVLDERGRIHPGCNVENASSGLTVCAERNAVARAVCAGAKSVRAVLVYAETDALTPPCGACRQVLAEFGPGCTVVLANGKQTREMRLTDLLPLRFSLGTS